MGIIPGLWKKKHLLLYARYFRRLTHTKCTYLKMAYLTDRTTTTALTQKEYNHSTVYMHRITEKFGKYQVKRHDLFIAQDNAYNTK
jgi:hypothetical protein